MLKHFAETYGGMDKDSGIKLRDEWSLGWLVTLRQQQQDPHYDFRLKSQKEWNRHELRSRTQDDLLSE